MHFFLTAILSFFFKRILCIFFFNRAAEYQTAQGTFILKFSALLSPDRETPPNNLKTLASVTFFGNAFFIFFQNTFFFFTLLRSRLRLFLFKRKNLAKGRFKNMRFCFLKPGHTFTRFDVE